MTEHKRGGAFFPMLFGGISLLFIAILIVAFFIAKKANPVMLDDQGRPQQTHRS